ncbi:hypothetical protein [Arcicella aurantiaca]|nr:hypothetical protein [Arcicella aurantiaca]
MKTTAINKKDKDIKTYKTVEEAFDAKHNVAKEFLKKVDMNKMVSMLKA